MASVEPGGIFPQSDPFEGITASDVGPDIAAELNLPLAPPIADVIADAEWFIRRFCILPDSAYLPLATWVAATHVSEAFDAFPYIALMSPAKRCGKTRVLEVLELLCRKAWRGTSPTSAALYRMMTDSPTLLLDEVEALRGKQVSEVSLAILAVLNAGHRKGATVPRCDGPKNEVKHFPVYGPKAFAAIGGLPDTLADRCVCLTMQRKTESQKVDRFLSTRAKAEARPLSESLAVWAEANNSTVESVYGEMGDLGFLSDRDADLWMPLFAVCAIAAPNRVTELKSCALVLTGAKSANDVEDSLLLKLLQDVRNVWAEGTAHMSTEVLLKNLREVSDSPWNEYELNARKLSHKLRAFGVAPRQVRIGALSVKGYVRTELEDAFSRYLPRQAVLSETYETNRINAVENEH
jgi:Protein of unknown function (DUF3631)